MYFRYPSEGGRGGTSCMYNTHFHIRDIFLSMQGGKGIDKGVQVWYSKETIHKGKEL
jgi:hypothetical protein